MRPKSRRSSTIRFIRSTCRSTTSHRSRAFSGSVCRAPSCAATRSPVIGTRRSWATAERKAIRCARCAASRSPSRLTVAAIRRTSRGPSSGSGSSLSRGRVSSCSRNRYTGWKRARRAYTLAAATPARARKRRTIATRLAIRLHSSARAIAPFATASLWSTSRSAEASAAPISPRVMVCPSGGAASTCRRICSTWTARSRTSAASSAESAACFECSSETARSASARARSSFQRGSPVSPRSWWARAARRSSTWMRFAARRPSTEKVKSRASRAIHATEMARTTARSTATPDAMPPRRRKAPRILVGPRTRGR